MPSSLYKAAFVRLRLFTPVESQSILSKFTLFQPLHPAVMFARLALLSLAVATASAAPTVPDTTQAPVDSCAGLGSGAFDTANNFTLAAFYTSLPNANATGLPLVLGSVAATDGAEYKALSVCLDCARTQTRGSLHSIFRHSARSRTTNGRPSPSPTEF